MTEKIIIDGVDVSGCKHFCLDSQIPEIPLAGNIKVCGEEYIAKECIENSSCYYKQLKRKEEECEKLKEGIKNEIQNTVDMERLAKSYGQDLQSYKANKEVEIEHLKGQLQAEQQKVKELEEELTLAKKNMCQKCDFQKEYFSNTKKLIKEKNKYKKVLEKIKIIVSGNYETLDPLAKQEISQKCEVLKDDKL